MIQFLLPKQQDAFVSPQSLRIQNDGSRDFPLIDKILRQKVAFVAEDKRVKSHYIVLGTVVDIFNSLGDTMLKIRIKGSNLTVNLDTIVSNIQY